MKVNRIHIMPLIVNRVDRMESIGTNQDNITFLTIEIMIVNVKLGASFVDINNLNICMPMEKNIRMAVFSNCPCQRVRSALVFIDGIFMQLS